MGNIIWLASYPKSGNTWFRLFLSYLLNEEKTVVDINDLHQTPNASNRSILDINLGFDSADLTNDESELYRPDLYRQLSDNAAEPFWMKIHDAYTFLPDGTPLIPTEATRCVLYFVRNPLDIAGSWANHNHSTMDEAINCMINPLYSISNSLKTPNEQLRQKLGTWSNHVSSWINAQEIPLHVIRFEDMKKHPIETFTKAMDFTGIEYSKNRIALALNATRFEKIQEQEKVSGFREKPVKAESFFRKGKVGSWLEELSELQTKKILDTFSECMKKYNYL